MKKINEKTYSWCDEVDDGTQKQIDNLINHKWVEHVAILPDCHYGYGVPIGSVSAFKDSICPNAVGSDIACSVSLSTSNLSASNFTMDDKKNIIAKARKEIAVGSGNNNKDKQVLSEELVEKFKELGENELLENAYYSIGSIGSGNHFLDLVENDEKNLAVLIHTGSRNIGKTLSDKYIFIANAFCTKYEYNNLVESNLSILKEGEKGFNEYLKVVELCLLFAKESHNILHNKIQNIIKEVKGNCIFTQLPIVNHNYLSKENHFNTEYYIHRKGAIKINDYGLIPGSQGTNSYIVKNNSESDNNIFSMNSCSHGAGRMHSRTKSKNDLDFNKEVELLEKQGILHALRTKNELDEATGAYKNIDDVMEQQSDLIKKVNTLRPLAILK